MDKTHAVVTNIKNQCIELFTQRQLFSQRQKVNDNAYISYVRLSVRRWVNNC